MSAATYKIAHLKAKGVDMVFVPLDPTFAQIPPADQATALKAIQQATTSAGLKGSVVFVWEKPNGQTGLLADRSVHQYLSGTAMSTITKNVNRQLTVQGLTVSAPPWTTSSSTTVIKATTGTISVSSNLDNCEILLDGTSVGTAPAKVKAPVGLRVIEVRKDGFEDFRQEVQVSESAESTVQANLRKDDSVLVSGGNRGAVDKRGNAADSSRKHRVGLMTMLFTDIVGSTKIKQELGDREAVRMIQWHHSLLRNILGGFPTATEINTQGDSFFIVFAKPSDAVRFALLLQAKLRESAKETKRKLLDRVGIHVGEVFIEEAEGSKLNDCYGIQVDSCARVMSLGEGDQILMTRFAFDNARQVMKGQEIEGIGETQWVNHGMYNLKGVEEPLEICEVGEIGLAVLRPPPDSDKVHRVTNDGEAKPAPGSGHLVVSTRSSSTVTGMRPFSSAIIKKQG